MFSFFFERDREWERQSEKEGKKSLNNNDNMHSFTLEDIILFFPLESHTQLQRHLFHFLLVYQLKCLFRWTCFSNNNPIGLTKQTNGLRRRSRKRMNRIGDSVLLWNRSKCSVQIAHTPHWAQYTNVIHPYAHFTQLGSNIFHYINR